MSGVIFFIAVGQVLPHCAEIGFSAQAWNLPHDKGLLGEESHRGGGRLTLTRTTLCDKFSDRDRPAGKNLFSIA